MKNRVLFRRASLLAVLMLVAAILAHTLTPTITTKAEIIDFESLVPRQFGEWRMDEAAAPGAIINPQLKETLDRIYTQTLSRTYVNREGRRIMLSLAYGADQSTENRIHRPEVCYPAQGFLLRNKEKGMIDEGGLNIPVMRLVAEMGNRNEPLTYWIRFGDKVVRGSIEQSLARIRFGLQGSVPDGLLFRVSEVNQDVQQSFKRQEAFIGSLLESLAPEAKKMLIGVF